MKFLWRVRRDVRHGSVDFSSSVTCASHDLDAEWKSSSVGFVFFRQMGWINNWTWPKLSNLCRERWCHLVNTAESLITPYLLMTKSPGWKDAGTLVRVLLCRDDRDISGGRGLGWAGLSDCGHSARHFRWASVYCQPSQLSQCLWCHRYHHPAGSLICHQLTHCKFGYLFSSEIVHEVRKIFFKQVKTHTNKIIKSCSRLNTVRG